MRIPGSKIEVSFEADCVIVKDNNASKIICIHGMTFEDVLSEVQTFAYYRNCRPARRLLRFLLLRTGLPNQTEFPSTAMLNQAEALGTIDDLSDKFMSPTLEIQPVEIVPENEESYENEHYQETNIPQSKRASIWTSDERIEIVYRFNPENIPKSTVETSA
ncbi:MAG: hypothetical protein ACXAEF_08455 [Candidatus Thorarchaeota archaeon]|jgi:hypothetical protein